MRVSVCEPQKKELWRYKNGEHVHRLYIGIRAWQKEIGIQRMAQAGADAANQGQRLNLLHLPGLATCHSSYLFTQTVTFAASSKLYPAAKKKKFYPKVLLKDNR